MLLLLAGVGAGLCGSVAGLASLISYPALLAAGIPPLAANVTNTTAMFGTTVGSLLGSRRELRGQGRRLGLLVTFTSLGGLAGAALLLSAPADTFEAVVPWLVALGATLLLMKTRLQSWAVLYREQRGPGSPDRVWLWPATMFLIGIYGGYFGAGVGIILLATLAVGSVEPLAVTNAVKNVSSGAANLVATVVYVFCAPIQWQAVALVGVGAAVGGCLGPRIVRVAPEAPLRIAIAMAGFGLAGYLALG